MQVPRSKTTSLWSPCHGSHCSWFLRRTVHLRTLTCNFGPCIFHFGAFGIEQSKIQCFGRFFQDSLELIQRFIRFGQTVADLFGIPQGCGLSLLHGPHTWCESAIGPNDEVKKSLQNQILGTFGTPDTTSMICWPLDSGRPLADLRPAEPSEWQNPLNSAKFSKNFTDAGHRPTF